MGSAGGILMEWPYPFLPIEDPQARRVFEVELQREVKPGHPLFGLPVAAIGQRQDQDDVLIELLEGSGRVAEVHLTWAGEKERPPWPATTLFGSFAEWASSVEQRDT